MVMIASPLSPRLAVRALIIQDGRVLLVNAYRDNRLDLWCAPGGGVERHTSLPENLAREVHEETGLRVEVGPLALVNEFHSPDHDFHQVELFFRCALKGGQIDEGWQDPEGIVNKRRWVDKTELATLNVKPSSLAEIAFGALGPAHYDPLEPILK